MRTCGVPAIAVIPSSAARRASARASSIVCTPSSRPGRMWEWRSIIWVRRGLGYARAVQPPLAKAFPRPSVVGVVNVTPDSFSDGGLFLRPEAAVAEALGLLEEGAALIDIGGESTRPGSAGVSVD